MQKTLNKGMTEDYNHLKLIAVTTMVEVTKGVSIETSFYAVVEIDFGYSHKNGFQKWTKQYHQYDTEVKAQRKFDRLNQHPTEQ